MTKTPIKIDNVVKHPIVFVLNEKTESFNAKDFENNPGFSKIFDFANEINGSVKYYNKKEDANMIGKVDYLVYFTEENKKSAELASSITKAGIKAFGDL